MTQPEHIATILPRVFPSVCGACMSDPLDTPFGREAMEALAVELYHDDDYGYCRESETCRHCQGHREMYRRMAARYLRAALPALERGFRKQVAEELEAEMSPFVIHGSPEHVSRETIRQAAAFLRKMP